MRFSKNARPGKRSSSNSSSYLPSVVTSVVFVAFCLLGLWMLKSSSSSSVIPSRLTTITTTTTPTRLSSSRFKQDSSRAAFDDNPGDLLDEVIKGGGGDDDDEEKGVADNNRFGSSEDDLGRKEWRHPIERPRQEEEEEQPHQSTAVDKEEPRDMEIEKPTESGGVGNDGDEQSLIQEMIHVDGDKRSMEEDNWESGSGSTDDEKQQSQQQATEEAEVEGAHEDQELKEIVKDEDNPQTQTEETVEENQQQSQTQPSFETQNQNQSQEEEGVENQLQLPSDESRVDNGLSQTEETVENEQPQTEETENQQSQTENIVEMQQSQTEESGESQMSPTEESVESHQFVSVESMEIQNPETEEKVNDLNSHETFPDGAQSEISRETNVQQVSWSTQADQSENKEERQNEASAFDDHDDGSVADREGSIHGYAWELCNVSAGPDYIPCLDNELALKKLHSIRHFEHRERHCPDPSLTCLVPLPKGYKQSIRWPQSRDKIWYTNVPHTKLAVVKGHQNWVQVTGEHLTFPGGGTQFIHGALHYIDFIQQSLPDIAWGKRTRVVLDVGCGVASFGGSLFEKDVLTMSFAPKDEHEAQVQLSLERGIPAISAVMGSQRLPFPSKVFDVVHCARCRVPWHAEGGTLLLELNRVLRPGGYFVWSATPVYWKLKEDVEIWKAMTSLTISMCWDLLTIKKDRLNSIGAAIYRKPTSNECYENRKHNYPTMCEEKDDPDAAWYVPLQTCMHRVPEDSSIRGSRWPEEWPVRMMTPPYWLNRFQVGVYGKPAREDFLTDYQHWKQVVKKSYLKGMGIDWSSMRNVMDMRAVYGGFSAALRDLEVWVMNVVNVDSPDTLPIIYDRGLFGIYHDWCESFSTYPRTYDLLHADHLFSTLKERCNIVALMAEIDRILRPGGKLIVRDDSSSVSKVENLVKSLQWEVRLTYSKDHEGILCAQKSDWRPEKI